MPGGDGKTSRIKPTRDPTKRNGDNGSLVPTKARGVKPRRDAYDMQGHTEARADRYLELSGKPNSSLEYVATPCLDDHQLDPKDDEQ